jgi:hypothetical protein
MAAVGGDTEAAARMVEQIESRVRTYCANCKRDATGFDEKLKQCKSCKAV